MCIYVTPSHCISGQIVGRNRAIVALKWCEVSTPAVSIRMLPDRESSQLPYFWTSTIRFWGTEITNTISVAWLYVSMFLSWKNLLINMFIHLPSSLNISPCRVDINGWYSILHLYLYYHKYQVWIKDITNFKVNFKLTNIIQTHTCICTCAWFSGRKGGGAELDLPYSPWGSNGWWF